MSLSVACEQDEDCLVFTISDNFSLTAPLALPAPDHTRKIQFAVSPSATVTGPDGTAAQWSSLHHTGKYSHRSDEVAIMP